MKGSEKKKHIDCDWLMKQKDGLFRCCDCRSSNKNENMTLKEAMQEACQYFHSKKDSSRKFNMVDNDE